MHTLLQDLRFGARMLVRSPGFALAAIVALGLGIGASTAVFTVLDGIVLKPLPYPNPEQLVMLWKEGEAAMVQHHSVDEAYFQTLGVPLLRGHWFEERDNADRADSHGVVLVNATLAKVYWPGENPVGRMITSYARAIGPLGRSLIRDSRYEVVGVVADVKNASLQNATEPAIFYTQRQFPFRNMHLVVRGRGSAESLTAVVRDAVRRLDPALPLSGVTTLDRVV